MNKKIAYPIICIAFLIGLLASYSLQETIAEQPEYAKWSRIAIEVMNENYKEAEISDFSYKGRKPLAEDKAQDSFLFQVKKNNQSFEVTVIVTFNPKTDKLQSLSIEEK